MKVSRATEKFYTARKQCEHPDCPWCARHWFKWYAARMAQMHVPRRNKGETVSFAIAAATSNIPQKEGSVIEKLISTEEKEDEETEGGEGFEDDGEDGEDGEDDEEEP